jgi:hypothetical protein
MPSARALCKIAKEKLYSMIKIDPRRILKEFSLNGKMVIYA